MKTEFPFETKNHSLTGHAAIDLLNEDEDLNSLAARLIDDYNPDRFDATVIRLFVQDNQPVITVYAVDKLRQEQNNYPHDRLPVKKFKMKLSFGEFLNHIKGFDFTVSNEAYDVKDILIENK